jgi:molybdate transport system substrate-binding protein
MEKRKRRSGSAMQSGAANTLGSRLSPHLSHASATAHDPARLFDYYAWLMPYVRSIVLNMFCMVLAAGAMSCKPSRRPLRIAAAADLTHAFLDIGSAFERDTGVHATFTFGATGILATQIKEGAPFDVFAAAAQSFADDVVQSGACDRDTKRVFAEGRLALWSRSASALPARIEELADRSLRIAMANPDHAPYGHAAQQVLQALGMWERVKTKIVYSDNVQQSLMFAQRGNADVAFVSTSLTTRAGGVVLPIAPALYAPLDQTLVVCGGASARTDEARSFSAYVTSERGRAILNSYGFALPEGAR